MQALRTLPLLNRPSRSSSPAPPSIQSSNPLVAGTITQPAISMGPPSETKPRSRSLSRQMTDKVASLSINGTSTSHTALPNIAPTPPVSRPATPRTPAMNETGPQGGYMDVLGLRFNETVNKACLGVDFKAKKGFKKGSGWSVGESVVHELPTPPSDAYLLRAVLRTAVRSLSIYLSRLESLLLPALTDGNFASPLYLAAPSATPLNPTQLFAVSIAHAAWETCEVLEQTLETGKWPRFVQETLRPVMDKFDLIVGKVIQPLLGGLKRDLVASITRTDGISPPGGKAVGLATIPAVPKDNRLTKEPSQNGTSRQLTIPVCLQHFASRVDASRKVLEIVAGPCQDDGEGWITGVVVSVVWKGMCVIPEKDFGSGRPPSPTSVAKALAGLGKEAGVAQKLANPLSILPSRAQSRPPSPPRSSVRMDYTTHALLSLEGLVKRLVNGLVGPVGATPIDPNSTEHIAREALFEACEALTSLRKASAAMNSANASGRMLASLRRLRDDIDLEEDEEVDDALEDLPAITLFHILLRKINTISPFSSSSSNTNNHNNHGNNIKIRSPAEIFGMTPADYERQVLGGFGTAEEWSRKVALGLKGDVEKVLASRSGLDMDKEFVDWVLALGVALDARSAVKVSGAE